jgi:hypothetical protein
MRNDIVFNGSYTFGGATPLELSYLSGLSGNIQYQLDNSSGSGGNVSLTDISGVNCCYTNASFENIGCRNISATYVFIGASGLSTIGDITTGFSDDRLKTRTSSLTECLKNIRLLDTFRYIPNSSALEYIPTYSQKEQLGLSAQQVLNYFPEVVENAPFNEQFLTIRYDRLIPVLCRGLQELSDIVETLS